MIERCTSVNAAVYQKYGAKDTTICRRWRESFAAFLEDMGERPDGTSLDRIDPDGHYEPGNCRWATALEQGRNKSSTRVMEIGGVRRTVPEWCEIHGIRLATFNTRLKAGWPAERAMIQPVKTPMKSQREGSA